MKIQIARIGSRSQQFTCFFDDFIAFNDFFANIEQPHAGRFITTQHRHQGRAHHRKLQQVLRCAVHIGPQVQHRSSAAFGVGQLGGNGGAVNAVKGFEQVAGKGHERSGVARRNGGSSSARLHLLDGHPHGGVFFLAHGYLHSIVHGDNLAGEYAASARVGKALHSLGQTHQQQLRVGVPIQEAATGGQGHSRAVVAAHAINRQGNHRALDCAQKKVPKEKGPSLPQ